MKGLHKKQGGWSALDSVGGWLILITVAAIAAPFLGGFTTLFSGGKLGIQVSTIELGAKCYHGLFRTYAAMDSDELLETDCVRDSSVFTNDFGGTNSVSLLSSNPAVGYVIEISGISNDGLGERKAREYQGQGDNASYSGGTLTIEKTL